MFRTRIFRSRPLGNSIAWLASLLVIAALASCTQGTSTTGAGPSAIQAFTLTLSTIKVYWTRDPMDTATDTVIVMDGSIEVAAVPVAFPLDRDIHDSAIVTGTATGTLYTIYIATSAGHSGSITFTPYLSEVPTNLTLVSENGNNATVSWSRFATDSSADTILVLTTDGALFEEIIIPFGDTSGTVTGLTAGETFVIMIATKTGRSSPLTVIIPGPPFNIAVNDVATGSIAVEWQRSPGDTLTDTLFAIDKKKGTINSVPVAYPDTTGTIFSLTTGDSIGISLHSFTGISDTLWWMTAERLSGIHLHVVSDLAAGDSMSLTFPGSTNPDLILDTSGLSSDSLALAAAVLAMTPGDSMKINPASPTIVGGLANNFRSANYGLDIAGATSLLYPIPPTGGFDTLGSPVIVCVTPSQHLVVVEIVPDPSSGLLYSVGPNGKFVTLNISFQSIAGAPYAARGRPAQPIKNRKSAVIPSNENILRKANAKMGTMRK